MSTVITDDLLFIHIPKTAGYAVTEYLCQAFTGWRLSRDVGKRRVGHLPLWRIEDDLGRHPRDFKHILAVIRDPYEQQFSQWRFWCWRYDWHGRDHNGVMVGGRHGCDRVAKELSFEDFVATDAAWGRALYGDDPALDMLADGYPHPEKLGGHYAWWLSCDGEPWGHKVTLIDMKSLAVELKRVGEAWGAKLGVPVPRKNEIPITYKDGFGTIEEHMTDQAKATIESRFGWAFATRYKKRTFKQPEMAGV